MVVGHDETIQKIQKNLENNSGAFLLSGPAGVGKTSIARLIGITLNGEEDGIFEIDAASNNKVDDVREIIKQVEYASFSDYRIYILDEAHQLTTAASNALLKTLEEPPENTFFVLCTTEIHKILDTIKSRCWHYSLAPIKEEIVEAYLNSTFPEEDENKIKRAARLCSGSIRNAIHLMEGELDTNNLNIEEIVLSCAKGKYSEYLGKIESPSFLKECISFIHKRLLARPDNEFARNLLKTGLEYAALQSKLINTFSKELNDSFILEIVEKAKK